MRLRATTIYLASNALSLLGNAIAGVVLPLVLLARTGDVLAAGSLALICAVPQFMAGFIGGAVLDRVDRKRVGIVSDLISAASVALLPMVDAVWGLSFGWFVTLGLLGAVGDVPGMTARDTLMPAACKYNGAALQRFVGIDQTLNALVSVAGPAAAALLIGFAGDVNALWVTAVCSLAAALVTALLPKELGRSANAGKRAKGQGAFVSARSLFLNGLRTLFAEDALIRVSILLSFGVTTVMGAFQGIVLPARFTAMGDPELAGYVVAAMGAGLLVGSMAYSAASSMLSKRAWLVISLAGMAAGVLGLGLMLPLPGMLISSVWTGFFAGPASALLGFFAYSRIPEDRRGVGMGALNALYLVVAPVGAFAASALIAAIGMAGTGVVLVAAWCALCVAALSARPLRELE